jgi:hypothetical protein
MPRLLFAASILFTCASSASAQATLSLIMNLTEGTTVASGFRDIPPGLFNFQITVQATSGRFYYVSGTGSSGQVSWMPQGSPSNTTTQTWVTATPVTEAQLGAFSGSATFIDNGQPGTIPASFYTTNVFWADIYDNSGDYPGGPYYDAGVRLPATNTSLPSSLPGGAGAGVPMPSLATDGSGSGSVWFTSSNANAAIYIFDQPSGNWIRADQPYPVTLPLSNYQFGMRATNAFVLGSVAQITVYYASSDSVNGTAGDTLDILNAFGDNPPNTDN